MDRDFHEGFCEKLAVRATKDTIPWKDVFDAENDPAELEKIFVKDKFQKTFHGQVDELIANKNFRKLAEKDPKHCLEKWAKMAKNIKKPAPEKAPEEADMAPKKVVKEENKAGRGMGGF